MSEQDTSALRRIAASFTDVASDREIKRGYLQWLRGSSSVLDVGCGEGRLLDVLREAGIECEGVDRDADAVNVARDRGHRVLSGDAIAALGAMAKTSRRFGAVAMVHWIEHVTPDAALHALNSARSLLEPGGLLLLVTPDPRNQLVIEETFWCDPTHVRPYPRALLVAMCREVGFRVEHADVDPRSRARRGVAGQLLAALRSFVGGGNRHRGMDSVVVARAMERSQ
ncbi:MAG: class I SAM-dependent methyltransferase [Planctomycetota bacterium]